MSPAAFRALTFLCLALISTGCTEAPKREGSACADLCAREGMSVAGALPKSGASTMCICTVDRPVACVKAVAK